MQSLQKTLIKCRKQLINFVRCSNIKSDSDNEWLKDNILLLCSSLDGAVRHIKKHKNADFGNVFELCTNFVENSLTPDFNILCNYFGSKNLNINECGALISFLYAAYAVYAGSNCGDGQSAQKSVRALNALKSIDAESLINEISAAEKLLIKDPAKIYAIMSESTKQQYRESVIKNSKKLNLTECEYILKVLKASENKTDEKRHIGFELMLPHNNKEYGKALTFAKLIFSALISVLLGAISYGVYGSYGKAVLVFFIVFLPVNEGITPIWDSIVLKFFSHRILPSLDSEKEINLPKSVITVSALLPPAGKAKEMKQHLKMLKMSDSLPNTAVLCLFDLKNAKTPVCSSDETDINAFKRIIDELNSEIGGFCMAVRERVYSVTEEEYTGFERKRGALCQLAEFLRGDGSFFVLHGQTDKLNDAKYMLCLDSDTNIPFEMLKKLTAAAYHPLNRARVTDGVVTQGFGIIMPRIETSVSSSGKTLFSRIFTTGGITAYSPEISEKNMDIFGQTVFTGKGLIDIDAYNKVCCNAFSNGKVLSHDILEGGLMHTAFMGSAVLTDSFPSRPESFFKRESRWVRGDIQNLIYALRPLKKGGVMLPLFTRCKILSNAARSITPILSLALIIASVFVSSKASVIFIIAGLLQAISEPIVSFFKAIVNEGANGLARMFFSSDKGTALRSFLRALFNIGTLPYNAVNNADAVIRALFRLFISKKKTLEWTTAAQSEQGKSRNFIKPIVLPLLFGVIMLIGTPLQIIIGIIFIAAIPFSYGNGILFSKSPEKHLSEKEKSIMLSYAASMWSFFDENVTAAENYLPPDNIQETPVKRTADRTSPTNIGLYLVSVLGACDMSFISPQQMCKKLFNCVNSIKKLPKYRGMLYNWYDTKKMTPLLPGFISSVDCGNYLCCLVALKQGLKNYAVSQPELNNIIEFCENELIENNILALFSPKRKLFSVGLDTASDTLSDSYYDLFMSESRLLSYMVTATRKVPVSHWGTLSRPAVKAGLYSATASWSGTMFEYFMPALFLPVFENTLQSEALRVCLYEQKRFVNKRGCPYGVSECGFYAFDHELNYRYKANGVSCLAISRHASSEPVFAPYATFLTLPFDIANALKNLSRFAYLHALGRYGFYEAVDFTPSRTENEDYMIVRSYMAHHVGMSFISAVNCLTDSVFVKRFMSDSNMLSAESLLQEKIPSDLPIKNIVRSAEKKPMRQKPHTEKDSANITEVAVYSDREATLLCSKYGENKFIYSGLNMIYSKNALNGLFAAVEIDNKVYPLNNISGTLTKTCYYNEIEIDKISVKFACTLPGTAPCAAFPVKIKNNGKKSVNVNLLYCFSPCMEQVFAPSDHRAFSDLFISTHHSQGDFSLLFERREKGLAVAGLSAGFADFSPFVFTLGRDKIFVHGIKQSYPFEKYIPPFDCNEKTVYPCAAIKLGISLNAGQKTEKVLMLCAGANSNDALLRLSQIRSHPLPDIRRAVKNPFAESSVMAAISQEFAALAVFGAIYGSEQQRRQSENNSAPDCLWRVGVSGDLPIITVINDSLPQGYLNDIVKTHKLLTLSGLENDLVFIETGSPDYMQLANEPVYSAIKLNQLEDTLGKRGGVHVLSRQADISATEAIQAFSAVLLPSSGESPVLCAKNTDLILTSLPLTNGENTFLPNGYFIGSPPKRPWCHTLSNSSFGTLLCDNSLGFSWALNSRLNKLTPDSGDTVFLPDGEMLIVNTEKKQYDCVFGASVYYYADKAIYKSVCGKAKVTVTVEVPQRGMKKQITVKTTGDITKISYRVKPLMCENRKFAHMAHFEAIKDGIIMCNPVNTQFEGYMLLTADTDFVTEINNGAAYIVVDLSKQKREEVTFTLAFARTKKAVIKTPSLSFIQKSEVNVKAKSPGTAEGQFVGALLLHTVFDTRFTARCGYYQCSGAYGFRDQLQDAANFVHYYPKVTKQHILRCASAQFIEGDVMHWFHVIPGKNACFSGVRTRCSDDMLWLPAVTAEYIKATGDFDILGINVPFRQGENLPDGCNERYEKYVKSAKSATLYRHCIMAIHRCADYGKHGLPLIKGGDWNDSFGEVGINGKGESVWLAMFLRIVCLNFLPLCKRLKDNENAVFVEAAAQKAATAVMASCRLADRYLRGFYDDGSPLGSDQSDACQIDILPQAFASFCELPCRDFTRTALITAVRMLTDTEHGVIKLFTPPFSQKTKRAGYVNDYPEGIRENGGQYTHAAVWLIMALKKEGMLKAAEELTKMVLPPLKYTDQSFSKYAAEPYSVCGDVYSAKGLEGVGGWSLYTGSAGWLLRLLTDKEPF